MNPTLPSLVDMVCTRWGPGSPITLLVAQQTVRESVFSVIHRHLVV